jgi:uncharacterized membrane protein YeaQ/YmgE (transglycosylase-associated protein family)
MTPVYWVLVGLIGGFFTGKLMRFHTVNWHGTVDAGIGIVGAVMGAAVFRGFGPASSENDWKVIAVAALSGIITTFILNDLARTRSEEINEHVVVEHHPEYAKLEHSFEQAVHVNDTDDGEVTDISERKGVKLRSEAGEGQRIA